MEKKVEAGCTAAAFLIKIQLRALEWRFRPNQPEKSGPRRDSSDPPFAPDAQKRKRFYALTELQTLKKSASDTLGSEWRVLSTGESPSHDRS